MPLKDRGDRYYVYRIKIVVPSGQKICKTTIGWDLCCQWRDGETSRVKLMNFNESYQFKVAEYAVANKILEEPAFSFWAKISLKCRNRMINAVKIRYWSRTCNVCLELPHSWE